MTAQKSPLREATLDRALELLARAGVDELRLREVARLMGVTAPAIIHAFGSRRGVLTAVATQAYEGLIEALFTKPLEPPARTYLQYAMSHPGHFEVMRSPKAIDGDDPRLESALSKVMALLAPDPQPGSRYSSREEALCAWALAHGLAQLVDVPGFITVGDDERQRAVLALWDAAVGCSSMR